MRNVVTFVLFLLLAAVIFCIGVVGGAFMGWLIGVTEFMILLWFFVEFY